MFELTRYNQRLQRSVEIFGFKVPYSVDELDAATAAIPGASRFPAWLCHADRLVRQRCDGQSNRINVSDQLQPLMKDYMKEVSPAAVSAG
ncbi:hypothetical protein [Rhizobium binae]|uniref:hypothetical protein n=1 Tax=Rhizobium binae TaxID=1138190 RepID=UPI001C8334FB|nr:hypothetical protein [Rhizobium binae]MBX4969298.1 hypothetical protein [Rhizobium binae]